MYTFNPLASIPVEHTGFGLICALALLIVVMCFFTEDAAYALVVSVPLALVCLVAYNVSYVWTDQTEKTFVNQQVVGEYVEFVAEGYAVDERSGKTTHRVDKHFSYVVYKVDGQRVLLRASVGQTYPERATLYKN
jgi:hypothetical protein